MAQKTYKFIFWSGYMAVLITSILNFKWKLDEKHVHLLFNLRIDHLLHLSAYFLICMYYLGGQIKGFQLFESRTFFKFIMVTLLLATVSEVAQLWVPVRSFNLLDWVANVSGIVLGAITIRIFRKKELLSAEA